MDAELVNLDFKAGQHKDPAFLAVNPFGKLPALTDDGFSLVRLFGEEGSLALPSACSCSGRRPRAHAYPPPPHTQCTRRTVHTASWGTLSHARRAGARTNTHAV